MNPVSLMADAGKLSIGQLQQAVRNGTVPAYIGIPIMQEKMKEAKQAQTPQAPSEPPIAHQVMAQASGIDQVPSNLPTEAMNDGGIVAFARGGASDVTTFDDDEDDDYEDYQLAQEEAEHQGIMAQYQQMEDDSSQRGGGSRTPVNRTPPVEGGIESIVRSGSESPRSGGEKVSPKDFYNNMYSTLKTKAEEMGFKNPEAIARVGAAQSALETGYGKYLAGGNNYFGIKGSGGNKQSTKEYTPERGYYTSNESFRTYGNMGDSAVDYLRLMQNPRYSKVASAETPEEAILHQGKSGYATSPHYAPSLRAIHQANMANGGIARLAGGGIASFSGTKGSLITNSSTPYSSAPKDEEELKTENNVFDIITPMQRRLQAAKDQAAADAAVRGQPIQEHNFNESIDSSLAGNFKPSPLVPAGAKGHGMPDYQPGLAAFPNMISNDGMYGGTPPSKDFSFAKPVVTEEGGANDKETTPPTGGTKPKERSSYDDFMDYFKKGHEDLKAQREEDKYMAILQAGLGMMAGTSPNALANIGQGASAGVAQYGAAAKQRAAEKNALLKGEITARRYQEMGEDRRSAQRIAESRYKDALDYRSTKDTNELDEKESARLARTEGAISKQIDTREKAIEAMVNKEYENIVLQSQPNAEAKKAARIAQLKAEDEVLKRHHKSLGTIYPKIFGFDYEAPNYGASTTTKREYFDVNGKPVK